jgi:hypothetical protein
MILKLIGGITWPIYVRRSAHVRVDADCKLDEVTSGDP